MKIALIGYGKMGHMIASIAQKRGHDIVATIDPFAKDATSIIPAEDSNAVANEIKKANPDCIIDFSHPSVIVNNIKAVLPIGIPLVVGTTGWNDKMKEIEELASASNGTIMTSANFSIGVNMFYKIIEEAVKLMNDYPEYDVSTWEMHHNQKADSPSGTALDIAKKILANSSVKKEIVTDAFHQKPQASQLHVSSTRCGSTPGTHTVWFDSVADTIELTHRARSREGFALGAVVAAENLSERINNHTLSKGKLYGMNDIL